MSTLLLDATANRSSTADVARIVREARERQAEWRRVPLRARLGVVRGFRRRLVERCDAFLAALRSSGKPGAEAIASEMLPVAEACRFLERSSLRLLRSRRVGRGGRPMWLAGVRSVVSREPLGVVLVVGPSNYPLQLAGIQTLQALVAGNGVVLKPGRDGTPVANLLSELLIESGLPPGLFGVTTEDPCCVEVALQEGVDKVVLTGSRESGLAVLRMAAEQAVPCTMELSGCDASFVLESADLDLTAKALAYGATLNGGRTCIAPRRVFVHRGMQPGLENRLTSELTRTDQVSSGQSGIDVDLIRNAVDDALERGARLVTGGITGDLVRPTLLTDVRRDSLVLETDLFAPVLSLVPVEDEREALEIDAECPFGLGASIFGAETDAQALALRLDVGSVTINDVIVPTADPRLPFGGRRDSGFGVTRGAEGLLEMTQPKVVTARRGRRRHLEPSAYNERTMRGLLDALHGPTLVGRLAGWWRLLSSTSGEIREDSPSGGDHGER